MLGRHAVGKDDISVGVVGPQPQDALAGSGGMPAAGRLLVREFDHERIAPPAAFRYLDLAVLDVDVSSADPAGG